MSVLRSVMSWLISDALLSYDCVRQGRRSRLFRCYQELQCLQMLRSERTSLSINPPSMNYTSASSMKLEY